MRQRYGPAGWGVFDAARPVHSRFVFYQPLGWTGLDHPASVGFTLDLQHTSAEGIDGGVSILTGFLERQSQTLGAVLSMSTRSVAPTLFNPVLRLLTAGPPGAPSYYAFRGGNFNVASLVLEDADYPTGAHTDPTLHMFGTQSLPSKYLSWDIYGAMLLAGP
jgi:hypothetical protein